METKFNELSFYEKMKVLEDLSNKIYIVGACFIGGQYLHIRLKRGANMTNVKSILKKYFGIDYYIKHTGEIVGDNWKYLKVRFCKQKDIIRLCKIFLEFNFVDLEYQNRFDPLGKRNTIAKRVYQYGEVRYDLLSV